MSEKNEDFLDVDFGGPEPFVFEVRRKGKSICSKYDSSRKINRVLANFKTKRGSMVKKEYLRVYIIRSFRKMIRKLVQGERIRASMEHESKVFESKYEYLESCIKDRIYSNLSYFKQISLPQNGPISDGNLSKSTQKSRNFRSYNNKFVKNFFEKVEIKECYFYFILYTFLESSFENLERTLKIKCCLGDHSNHCEDRWKEIKDILLSEIFINIGITPWTPSLEDGIILELYSNKKNNFVEETVQFGDSKF